MLPFGLSSKNNGIYWFDICGYKCLLDGVDHKKWLFSIVFYCFPIFVLFSKAFALLLALKISFKLKHSDNLSLDKDYDYSNSEFSLFDYKLYNNNCIKLIRPIGRPSLWQESDLDLYNPPGFDDSAGDVALRSGKEL